MGEKLVNLENKQCSTKLKPLNMQFILYVNCVFMYSASHRLPKYFCQGLDTDHFDNNIITKHPNVPLAIWQISRQYIRM